MNAMKAYRQHRDYGMTRIDMLLALIEGAIERVERALTALQQNDAAAAAPLLARGRLLVLGLVAGVNPGAEMSGNFLRLYDFVLRQLAEGGVEGVSAALPILRTLNEGFQAIRGEALTLERAGAIPPVDSVHAIQATA